MTHTSRVAFRRAQHLVSYWVGADLLIHNYATGTCVAVEPELPALLDYFHTWRTGDEIRKRFGASIRSLTPLLDATLIERSDRPGPPSGTALSKWQDWNPAAGFFHMATRGSTYMDPFAGDRALRRKARVDPMPSSVKRFPGAKRIALPRLRADQSLSRILLERRTWRRFSRAPLPLTSLGQLLGLTNGVQQWATLRGQGDLPLKTSPSGGARHPVELYVLAWGIEGLEKGLYHYASDVHALEVVQAGLDSSRVPIYLPNGDYWSKACAVILFSAVYDRELWRYGYSRAYRAPFIEAGHLCQTFCVLATEYGLAPFCAMALADTAIETDLRIDGVTESVLYAAGVGVRPDGIQWAPAPDGFAIPQVEPNPHLQPR